MNAFLNCSGKHICLAIPKSGYHNSDFCQGKNLGGGEIDSTCLFQKPLQFCTIFSNHPQSSEEVTARGKPSWATGVLPWGPHLPRVKGKEEERPHSFCHRLFIPSSQSLCGFECALG